MLLLSLSGFAQEQASFRDLKSGKVKPDTSYVYSLPYEKGKKHLLVQSCLAGMFVMKK